MQLPRLNPEITIRPWKFGDIPAVQKVLWDTWVATYASFIPMNDLKLYFDTHYSGEEIEKLFSVSEVEGYVAEIDAVVVGYLRGQNKKEEKYYNIVSLYVLPEYQGRGIGHKLLSLAEKRTIELGEKEIWLGVMTQNKESVDWYKRVGFEFLKEEPFVMGSTTVPHLIGRKLVK